MEKRVRQKCGGSTVVESGTNGGIRASEGGGARGLVVLRGGEGEVIGVWDRHIESI